MSLKKSFIKGVAWRGVARFGGQGLQFVTTIILARLLSPTEFGLIGIANIFILFANTINQLGIASSIVQRKEIDEGHLSTAFWINIITGMVLCVLMIFISFPAASFFRNDAAQPVIATLSFIFILGALRIVQNAQFSRKLEFKKIARVEIWELFLNSVMTITLAVYGFKVWSLVYGRLFGVFMGVLIAWGQSTWRPKFIFNIKKFKELFRFGIHAMSVNILTYFGTNVDYIIVGRFLGASPLGIYTMAYNLVTLPRRKLSSVITGVAFPAFSRIQDQHERFARNYLKMLTYISFFTFPLLAGLCVLSPIFVRVLLGAKWLEAIIPMQIMCVLGMLSSVGTTMGSIFYAKGRPDLEFRVDFINIVLLVGCLLYTVRFGIIGVAVTVTILGCIMIPVVFYIISQLIKVSYQAIVRALWPALVGSAGMGLGIYAAQCLFNMISLGEVLQFPILIVLGMLFYFLFEKILFKDVLNEILNEFKEIWQKRKEKN